MIVPWSRIIVFLVSTILSGSNSFAVVTDVEFYLLQKDKKGEPLVSHIHPFAQYGDPENRENIKVTVVGAVMRPGVYYVTKGTRILDLIEKAGKLNVEGCPVESYTNKIPIFRNGAPVQIIPFFEDRKPINRDFAVIQGDVIKVRAVVL